MNGSKPLPNYMTNFGEYQIEQTLPRDSTKLNQSFKQTSCDETFVYSLALVLLSFVEKFFFPKQTIF